MTVSVPSPVRVYVWHGADDMVQTSIAADIIDLLSDSKPGASYKHLVWVPHTFAFWLVSDMKFIPRHTGIMLDTKCLDDINHTQLCGILYGMSRANILLRTGLVQSWE